MITFDVVEHLDDIPESAWAAWPSILPASRQWLSFQAHERGSARVRIFCARRGKSVVAAIVAFTVDVETHDNYRPPFAIKDTLPQVVTHLGNRHGYTNALLIPHEWRSEPQHESMTAFLEFLTRELETSGLLAGAWFPYLTRSDAQFLSPLLGRPQPLLQKTECLLTLEGHEFGDYLDSLPSNTRSAIRRQRRRFSQSGLSVTSHTFSETTDLVARLGRATVMRHGGDLSLEASYAIARAQSALDADGMVLVASDDDGPVGFSTMLLDDQQVHMRTVGFDYARLRNAFEYFELTYYLPIEYAYRTGRMAVSLGIGAYEAKVLRGGRLDTRWALPLKSSLWMPDVVAELSRARADLVIAEVGHHQHAVPSELRTASLEPPHTATPVDHNPT